MTQFVIACVLVLSAANVGWAQTLTANGTTGAVSIYRGDTVTITTTGISTDWVGLFPVGAANGAYLDWFYLNGTKSSSPPPSNPAVITFKVLQNPGAYEFRKLTKSPYTLLATSGVVTMQPATIKVNGISAPQTVLSEPRASMQVDVLGSYGCTTDWVGIYRLGAVKWGLA